MNESTKLSQAAEAIDKAEAILISSGAGMGVDSGLPDFRGNEGFWKAYPPIAKRGLSFSEMANPNWFNRDPVLAWSFYGHRLNLYRETTPHEGFSILKKWAENKKHGYSIFTSNVDGQFQKAGFDDQCILECHGSIHHFQCTKPCSNDIWSAEGIEVDVDLEAFKVKSEMPHCPKCGALARPNILMFGDWFWNSERSDIQSSHFHDWVNELPTGKLVVVECGAGTAVPTVRSTSIRLAENNRGKLIRINVREPEIQPGHIGINLGALDAIKKIDQMITS